VPADDDRTAACDSSPRESSRPVETEPIVRVFLRHHRVDVAEGVGGRDLPVDERIVHDRGKEVHGLDDRQVRREAVDSRVVVRLGADEQVGIAELG
jgi:hypothetical protein